MAKLNHSKLYRPRTRAERISSAITAFCGSMKFIYFHAIWFGSWLVYNSFSPNAFDPFPFGLLTLIVSLEAIILATFILISQNRAANISERRARLDYKINVKAEKENLEMLKLLRQIRRKLDSISK